MSILAEAARLHPGPYTSAAAASSPWAQWGGALLRSLGKSHILDYPVEVLQRAATNLGLPADTATKNITFMGGVPVYWFQSPEELWLVFTRLLAMVVLGAFVVIRYYTPFTASYPAAAKFRRGAGARVEDDGEAISKKKKGKAVESGSGSEWFRSFRAGLETVLRPLDIICRVACVITLVATFAYKVPTGRWPFMLQPCHWLCSVLTYLCFVKDDEAPTAASKGVVRKSTTNAVLFNFFLCCVYGPIAALLVPDMRGLDLPFEQFNFWLEHIVLVVLPAIWVARRRFDLIAGFPFVAMCWCIFWVIHGVFLIPVSVVTGSNIDYVLAPPKQWPSKFPTYTYYPGAMAFFAGAALFVRYVVLALWVRISGVAKECALEQEEQQQQKATGTSKGNEQSTNTAPVSASTKSRGTQAELPAFLKKAAIELPADHAHKSRRKSSASPRSNGANSARSSARVKAEEAQAAANAGASSAVLRFALYKSPPPRPAATAASKRAGHTASQLATLVADGGSSPRQPPSSEVRKRASSGSRKSS